MMVVFAWLQGRGSFTGIELPSRDLESHVMLFDCRGAQWAKTAMQRSTWGISREECRVNGWKRGLAWAQNARLQEVDQSGTLVGGHLKPLPQVWWLVASLATCYLSEMHFWTPLEAACVRQDHSSYLRTRNIQGRSDYSPSYWLNLLKTTCYLLLAYHLGVHFPSR